MQSQPGPTRPVHLVFDFGAVVLQWQPAEVVSRHFPSLCGTPAQAQRLAQQVFASADWHAFDAGLASPEATADRLVQRLGLDVCGVRSMIACIDDHLQPIGSTVALIESLHSRRQAGAHIRLHFLSNMPQLYARGIEARHPFMRCFESGIFSGDVKLAKPDDAIFRLAEDRFGVAKGADVFFVDDHPANIEAAQRRNWRCHLVQDVSALASVFDCALSGSA